MVQKIGGEAMWLRLHDPRVWLNLRWILRPLQVDALLGPISHWSWPVPGSERWTASTSERAAAQRLDLDIEQMRALSMTGSVNRVSPGWRATAPRCWTPTHQGGLRSTR